MLGILEHIRTKKRELAANSADAYLQLVRDVASGIEADVEQAALIIEQTNKSDAEFEKDVDTQQQRVGLAAKLKRKKELETQLPKLMHAERLAGEHYDRVVSEASTKLNAAKKNTREVNAELACLMQVESQLRDSCLDQTLLIRERELTAKRMALFQKRKPLSEDLDHEKNVVKSLESSVDALNRRSADRNLDPVVRSSYKKDLVLNERALERKQDVVKQLKQAIASIDSEIAPLDRELEAIRERKLEV
jgi:hypothetical protein